MITAAPFWTPRWLLSPLFQITSPRVSCQACTLQKALFGVGGGIYLNRNRKSPRTSAKACELPLVPGLRMAGTLAEDSHGARSG